MTAEKAKRKRRILVPVLIIIGGFIVMFSLIASRKKPVSAIPEFAGVLVEVQSVAPATHQALISGSGTVKAKQEVALAPQVGGKVDWVSEQCTAGGTFRKGDVLFRIESIDYELAVEQASARVAQAEYQISVELAQAEIAKQEWGRMVEKNLGDSNTPSSLVLREPQIKQAESNLSSARAALRQAELALERSQIRAPFSGRVKRETVDVGQMLSPGMTVGVLYSTDVAEIEVGLPIDEQMLLEIPGSRATVSFELAGQNYSWQGEVVRWVGALDSIGRLARVIVEVNDPYAAREDGGPDLAVGSFVRVEMTGRPMENVVALPTAALRSGDVVWIAGSNEALDIRSVGVALKTRDVAYINRGLNNGDRVVLTSISGAANGLKLRVAGGANG